MLVAVEDRLARKRWVISIQIPIPFSLASLSVNPLLSTSAGGGRVKKFFKHP